MQPEGEEGGSRRVAQGFDPRRRGMPARRQVEPQRGQAEERPEHVLETGHPRHRLDLQRVQSEQQCPGEGRLVTTGEAVEEAEDK